MKKENWNETLLNSRTYINWNKYKQNIWKCSKLENLNQKPQIKTLKATWCNKSENPKTKTLKYNMKQQTRK
jgi:hypothetical protein